MIKVRLLIACAGMAMSASAFSVEPEEAVLIAPLYSKEAVLLDVHGKEVHRWTGDRQGAGGARVLEGGRLLRLCQMPVSDVFKKLEARGGGLEILDKNGKSEWVFWNAVTHHISWGDALMLPNGNILSVILDWKSKEESMTLGRKPEAMSDLGMLFPGLMEIQPLENNRGRVVWEWHLYDHLGSTGKAAQAPSVGQVSIHEADRQKVKGWLSPANLSYDPAHDVIAFVVQGLEEVWLVDHSTTTEEARAATGGTYRRGGRLLLRYPSGTTASNRPHLRGYRLIESDKRQPIQIQAHFALDTAVHEETVSVDPSLSISTAKNSHSWKLPAKSPGLLTTPGYLEKTGDDQWIATHLLEGIIIKFNRDGKVLWRYENALGTRNIITSKDDGEACCGNGPQDIPINGRATKVAPVYRAVTVPFSF